MGRSTFMHLSYMQGRARCRNDERSILPTHFDHRNGESPMKWALLKRQKILQSDSHPRRMMMRKAHDIIIQTHQILSYNIDQATIQEVTLAISIQQMQKEVSTYQQLVEFIFKNGGVVVAQFFNNWSAPCKLITPHLDSLRSQLGIAVARIDTDRSQELSSKFDIHALPSFLLLRKASGEVTAVEMVVSAHVEKLKRLFESASNIKNNKN